MAKLPSIDEKVRMVLDIYEHFGTRAGQGLLPQNFLAIAAKRGWQMQDVTDGLTECLSRGLIIEGERMIMLTDAGFSEV